MLVSFSIIFITSIPFLTFITFLPFLPFLTFLTFLPFFPFLPFLTFTRAAARGSGRLITDHRNRPRSPTASPKSLQPLNSPRYARARGPITGLMSLRRMLTGMNSPFRLKSQNRLGPVSGGAHTGNPSRAKRGQYAHLYAHV